MVSLTSPQLKVKNHEMHGTHRLLSGFVSLGSSIFFLLIAVSALGWLLFTLPDVSLLREFYPEVIYPPRVEVRTSQKLAKKTPPVRNLKVTFLKKRPLWWVNIERLPKWVIGAILTSEDWAFYSHFGLDLGQLQEVFEASWKKGKWVRGASTITQQVAKNVFLSQERSLLRKLREVFVAIKLEQNFSKSKILETYLNIVELGNGITGIQRASEHYFHKSASGLNPKEAAFIAMLLPNPRKNSISHQKGELTQFASAQISRILDRMLQAGYINYYQHDVSASTPLPFERLPSSFDENISDEAAEPVEAVDDGVDATSDDALDTGHE